MVFVQDGIIVPTPFASRPISFANKFFQMDLVGPLTIYLYSSDAPVVGSMTTFLDDVPAYLSLVLQHVAILAPLLFLALWYCTGVLPTVVHACFLDWTGKFLLSILRFLVWIHPWRWGCLIFHPWKFSIFLHYQVWGVGNASLFGILVSASKI